MEFLHFWFVITSLFMLAIWVFRHFHIKSLLRRMIQNDSTQHSPIDNKDPLYDPYHIEPLPNFDWRTTPPLKLRNFKPKYHLTMGSHPTLALSYSPLPHFIVPLTNGPQGLTTTTFSSLLEIDTNYLTRLSLRTQIIRDHHETAIQAHPTITPAVHELFTFLTSLYLPTRFPTLFTLSPTSILNTATSLSLPLIPPSDPVKTLELLGQNLDEDFLLLLPSEDGDGYKLRGYVTCFPSGFNTKEKFGQKLREIHKPVPGYKEKLELSMDRFFDRLEVGKVVLRSNWSITTHGRLFAASGNHLYAGEEPEEEDVDINNTFLRCERQTLHRLPHTKALVFAFKTYMYPLSEIKEEGSGEELAHAIEGLEKGSVPEMMFYKRGVVWGEAVKAFLRS